jgi:hypothetical protein
MKTKITGLQLLMLRKIGLHQPNKSNLTKHFLIGYWRGWRSPDFVSRSREVTNAIENLIDRKIVGFTPKMPLKLLTKGPFILK